VIQVLELFNAVGDQVAKLFVPEVRIEEIEEHLIPQYCALSGLLEPVSFHLRAATEREILDWSDGATPPGADVTA
jgi:hypothetical protein